MATLTFYAERTPEVLARVVLLFHRRAIRIDSLTMESSERANVLRIFISVQPDTRGLQNIVANLYKLVEVILVEHLTESEARHANT